MSKYDYLSLTPNRVTRINPCRVGDKVKIITKGASRVVDRDSEYYLHKTDKEQISTCIGVYRWFLLFNNGLFNHCINKTDLLDGDIQIKVL